MGISRDKWHKRRKTGGKRKPIRSKRKFELGRQPANTKLGERRVHKVRGHGGFIKFKALKVDHGNYSWPGEAVTRKTRIIGVVYNPTNPEFVRTNTIVKGSIIQIDATPFKNWYQKHYGVCVGKEVAFVKPKKVKKLKRGEKPKKEKKNN
jgi:small subunit ribosomal protein S8e